MSSVLNLPGNATPRGVCAGCGQKIYSSGYRRQAAPEDPWVHANWAREEYDHPATPKLVEVTLKVSTWDPKLATSLLSGTPGIEAVTELERAEGG